MAHAEQRGTNKIIMPLFSNVKFLPFLRNLICSIERLAVRSWLTIDLDNRACAALQKWSMCSPYHGAASADPYGATFSLWQRNLFFVNDHCGYTICFGKAFGLEL